MKSLRDKRGRVDPDAVAQDGITTLEEAQLRLFQVATALNSEISKKENVKWNARMFFLMALAFLGMLIFVILKADGYI